jgi:hypothetical protein
MMHRRVEMEKQHYRKYSSGMIYLVCGLQDILIDFPECL